MTTRYVDGEDSEMKTKSAQARECIYDGRYKDALRIIKTFRQEFTATEKRIIQIAFECMSGNSAFYTSIGIDVQKMKDDAIVIIKLWAER